MRCRGAVVIRTNGETRAPQVEAPDADEIGLPARAEIEAPDAETATRVPPSAAQAGEPQSNEPQPHTWSNAVCQVALPTKR